MATKIAQMGRTKTIAKLKQSSTVILAASMNLNAVPDLASLKDGPVTDGLTVPTVKMSDATNADQKLNGNALTVIALTLAINATASKIVLITRMKMKQLATTHMASCATLANSSATSIDAFLTQESATLSLIAKIKLMKLTATP